ncbi:MAG: squalene synthase HpnC [Ignavibacteriales bacterium]|nr:squalene synthase HpnC [Ignavibacteriales bacterium]
MSRQLRESYQYCEQLAFSHYENFPVASLLIPREKRKHVAAIYAFARIADDYADEPGLIAAERLEKLRTWEQQLSECYGGKAIHPVFVALGETANEFSIPQGLFHRLLKAFGSDVTTTRYEVFNDVLAYCTNSANPVGRLVLLLFGYVDKHLAILSDHICTALQLTNFWQDLSVDLAKDRIYLPLEDLRRFGVTVEELRSRKASEAFRHLMEFEVERTASLFEQGKPLLREVGKDLRLQLRMTWLGGMEILSKIRRRDFDVLSHRPVLSGLDNARLVLKAIV